MASTKDLSRQLGDDEYLAEHAVAASPADWAPGPNEAGGEGYSDDDASPKTIVKEAPAEGVAAVAEGEAAATTGEPSAEAAQSRFTSQEEAERAYTEAQRFAAQRDSEADLLRRRIEELEQRYAQQQQVAVDPTAQIVQMVETDPYAAFSTAMQQAPQAVPAVIAAVQADATLLAQQAAQARADDDEAAAAAYDRDARSATYVAEQMRAAHMQAAQSQGLQSQQVRNFEYDLAAATQDVYQETAGAAAAFGSRIAAILAEQPALLGDGSRQALAVGVRSAYRQAYGEWVQTPEGSQQYFEQMQQQNTAAQQQADAQAQAAAQAAQQQALDQRRAAAGAETHGSAAAVQLDAAEQDAFATRDLLGLEGNPRETGIGALFALGT